MRRLRVIFQLVAVAFILSVASCGGDDRQELVRPVLSQSALSIVEGDEAYLSVSSAQNVTATVSDENVISVTVSGCDIRVKALSQGMASVKVNADGHWLQCNVTVIAGPYSFLPELDDNTPRFVSESLSLKYSDETPGIIFTRDDGNGIIEIISLDSGAYVVFNPGAAQYGVGALENATLTVNGKSVELSVVIVERYDESGLWLNLDEAVTGKHIVLVLSGL